MTLGVGHGDQVVVIEVIYPEEIGWQPWFDQPEGEPSDALLGDLRRARRWLVLRKLMLGARHFDDIHRGVDLDVESDSKTLTWLW